VVASVVVGTYKAIQLGCQASNLQQAGEPAGAKAPRAAVQLTNPKNLLQSGEIIWPVKLILTRPPARQGVPHHVLRTGK
jgi:hypothetical protein